MPVDWKDVLKSLKEQAVPKRWDMNELTRNFFEGLFLLVPVVVTVVVVLKVFEVIDGWLNIPIPGLGFLITIILIVLAGRLASNVFFSRSPWLLREVIDPHSFYQTGLYLTERSY